MIHYVLQVGILFSTIPRWLWAEGHPFCDWLHLVWFMFFLHLQEETRNSRGTWCESRKHKLCEWRFRVWNGTTFAPHTWIDSSNWVLLYEGFETNDLLVQIVKNFATFPSKTVSFSLFEKGSYFAFHMAVSQKRIPQNASNHVKTFSNLKWTVKVIWKPKAVEASTFWHMPMWLMYIYIYIYHTIWSKMHSCQLSCYTSIWQFFGECPNVGWTCSYFSTK